jgi:uncharacterized membrane protein
MDQSSQGDYPEHIREAAEAIDELRSQRHRQIPKSERAVQRFMDAIARPRFILILALFIVAWIVLNDILAGHHSEFDDRKFTTLNLIAQLTSLMLVFAILSQQKTQSTLEQERARLMLQLMLIQDRKVTEVLNAVEDLRRVDPRVETPEEPGELHKETDVHTAARALLEAESQDAEGASP